MKKLNQQIKSCFVFFVLIFGVQAVNAQMNESQLITDVREIDLNSINYDASTGTYKNKGKAISYSDIEGSAFWDDKWNPAIIYFNNGSKAKINQAKLNLYSDEVYYLGNDGTEWVVGNEGITRLVFLNKNNLTQPIASFAKLVNHVSDKGTAYYKVLNAGSFQLILLQKQYVKTSPYDPLLGKSVSSFYSKKNYAIYNEGKIIPLEDLNKKAIQIALPNNAILDVIIKDNKSKLKSEKDFTDLLSAYNKAIEK